MRAVSHGWIEFWCQPKIQLRRKQLAGIEILARLRHPQHGLLGPSSFLSGADDAALLALSELAVITAIKTSIDCLKLGLTLPVSFNASLHSVNHLPLLSIAAEMRRKHIGWPGLIIDVGEIDATRGHALPRELAAELAAAGVRLAVDGVGEAGLPIGKLREIGFTEVKLNRSLVAGCSNSATNARICQAVVELAHTSGGVAVAVGVENGADAHTLFRLGCDIGQGFLFGRPMEQEQFVDLLRTRASRAGGLAA